MAVKLRPLRRSYAGPHTDRPVRIGDAIQLRLCPRVVTVDLARESIVKSTILFSAHLQQNTGAYPARSSDRDFHQQ